MKIGFYLENKNVRNVDLSHPRKGNPGCGGTEFLFVALAYELAKKQNHKCTPLLLANHTHKLPNNLIAKKSLSIHDAIEIAKQEDCDLFVYRPRIESQMDIIEKVDKLEIPTIGWAHTPISSIYMKKMAQSSFFKALVCVEHEQYDLIQDSTLWKKLTYIPNGFDVDNFCLSPPPEKNFNLVVYVGSLVHTKGFHLLARVWPQVIARIPNAKLTVIGTGNLYNENAKLGRWGIADKEYEENYIIPYLSDSKEKPHSSVNFMGKLGYEKKKFIHQATVGIVNPTGSSECCPGSALEFSSLRYPRRIGSVLWHAGYSQA